MEVGLVCPVSYFLEEWAASDLNTRPPLCKSGIITSLDQPPATQGEYHWSYKFLHHTSAEMLQLQFLTLERKIWLFAHLVVMNR